MAEQAPRQTITVSVSGPTSWSTAERWPTWAEAPNLSDGLIPGLKAELDLLANRQVLGADKDGASKAVTILGDKRIPYRLLRKVMATSARAGFAEVSFAVQRRHESCSPSSGRATLNAGPPSRSPGDEAASRHRAASGLRRTGRAARRSARNTANAAWRTDMGCLAITFRPDVLAWASGARGRRALSAASRTPCSPPWALVCVVLLLSPAPVLDRAQPPGFARLSCWSRKTCHRRSSFKSEAPKPTEAASSLRTPALPTLPKAPPKGALVPEARNPSPTAPGEVDAARRKAPLAWPPGP